MYMCVHVYVWGGVWGVWGACGGRVGVCVQTCSNDVSTTISDSAKYVNKRNLIHIYIETD